jgi:hypothetical protein
MRILLQSTIRDDRDDWHVGRFSMLAGELRRSAEVVARNLEPDASGHDPVLAGLSRRDFDEVWLLGVDGGRALSVRDLEGLNRFHESGGGLFTTRDHENMGMWLRGLRRVGPAHFFHDPSCWDPDPERRCADDRDTPTISWPNYHSGRNGDFERIEPLEPLHPLLWRPGGGSIELFPAHPHEGAVGAPPDDPAARVVALGRSTTTGRVFPLFVAFERAADNPGRAIADSSFHHLADLNWDSSRGAPSFVTEPPGDGMQRDPRALPDIHAYVANAAAWLQPV